MKHGAVALIDALGFRGIWERVPSDDVLKKMTQMSTAIPTYLEEHGIVNDPEGVFGTRIIFLSDSIFIAAWRNDHIENVEAIDHKIGLLGRVTLMAGVAAGFGLDIPPPLAYRGCISFGEFDVDEAGKFVIGKAVDEVAENETLADGAFVWLTPSAREIVDEWGRPFTEPLFTKEYDVPLKNGRYYRTIVTDPVTILDLVGGPPRPANVLATLMRILPNNNVEQAIKRDNTLHYYEKTNFGRLQDAKLLLKRPDQA